MNFQKIKNNIRNISFNWNIIFKTNGFRIRYWSTIEKSVLIIIIIKLFFMNIFTEIEIYFKKY